jgi:hypothetical protein
MAANTSPIFSLTPDISTNGTTGAGLPVTLAAADYTGISANYVLLHTVGSNGSFISQIRCVASGTNVATVARLFANNGSAVGTATNNCPIDQIALPATTATNTAATPTIIFPLNLRLPTGWKLYIGIATAVAAGWTFVAETGQY